MEKSASLIGRIYTKDEVLNREKLILVVNSDVPPGEVNIKNGIAKVLAKTRKLVAALPRRLKEKR